MKTRVCFNCVLNLIRIECVDMMQTQMVKPSTVNKIAAEALKIDRFMTASGDIPNLSTPSEWHTGLCNCYTEEGGCQFFLIACCCPCVAYGMNYSLMVAGSSCNPAYCFSPCCLFAALEVIETTIVVAQSTGQNGSKTDLSGIAQLCMIYQHRYTVGKSAGIYTDENWNTKCAICCETTFCAPCVQTQIRNEVVFQRRNTVSKFGFMPLHNICCAFCCCAEDCGCAGCVDIDINNANITTSKL